MANLWIIVIALLVIFIPMLAITITKRESITTNGIAITSLIVTLTFGIVLLVSIIFISYSFYEAKQELVKFEETKMVAEYCLTQSDRITNQALLYDINNANIWLFNIKANKKLWGNWSHYYYIDESKLEIICDSK